MFNEATTDGTSNATSYAGVQLPIINGLYWSGKVRLAWENSSYPPLYHASAEWYTGNVGGSTLYRTPANGSSYGSDWKLVGEMEWKLRGLQASKFASSKIVE